MAKIKVTLTIDKNLIEKIDSYSKEYNESRSQLVENAIKIWYEWKLKEELISSYQSMAKKNLKDTELALSIQSKVIE